MSRTLGQVLSSYAVTDDQVRAAIKEATVKDRNDQVAFYERVLTRRGVYRGWLAKAKRNLELLKEKVK